MADALEKSILDGTFFRGPRTPSPTRSASTASNSGSDDEGFVDEEDQIPTQGPATQRRSTTGRSTNTGPKGVIADRNAAREAEKEERRQRIIETNERLRRLAVVGSSTGELSDEDEEEEDNEVLRRYRAARIAEMQGQSSTNSQNHFGHLVEINDDRQYLSAIEGGDDEDDGHVVVVHIYSRTLQRCKHLSSSLSSLARQRPTTKFIQVQADVIEFGGGDDDVLPTLLVYKDSDLVANLVRVDLDQNWGKGEERDVERVLKSHGTFT